MPEWKGSGELLEAGFGCGHSFFYMSECQLCESKDNLVLNPLYLPNIKQIAALHLLQALHEHQWQLSPSVLIQTCSVLCLLSSLISSLVWTERSLKLSSKKKFTHCCFEFVTNWSSLSWLLFLHLIIQLGSCNTIVSFLWWFWVEGHDELELWYFHNPMLKPVSPSNHTDP